MDVIVYTTPVCPYCRMVKEFLRNKGIGFEEIDVSNNQDLQQEVKNTSGQTGVPVTVVKKENGSEEVIVGFDQEKLDAALV